MVSIIGFLAGIYIIALRAYPKEAKYLRESLLEKIDSLFSYSKETVQKSRELEKRKTEETDEGEAKEELKQKKEN